MGNDEVAVKAINANAFATAPTGNVRWLTIPTSITYIGANAFKGLTNTLVFVSMDTDTSKWESGWNNGVLKYYTNFGEIKEVNAVTLATILNNKNIILDGVPSGDGLLDLSNVTAVEVAPKAFASRNDIKSVKIDSSSINTIGNYAFANCYNLKSLYYNMKTLDSITIGDYAFYTAHYDETNNGVIDIYIDSGASLKIGKSAFEKGYKVVVEKLVYIYTYTNIDSLHLKGDNIDIGASAFLTTTFNATSITLDDDAKKPGVGAFPLADENFTINVSSSLFNKMQNEWGWPLDVEKKLSLHTKTDENGTYYQLYTKWPTTEPAYERFGKAHIVVNS